ncbi:axin-1-like isoform X2 [Ctenopharyngodon idella]|uniref:axin-1-like isoform X2 n=1 Tax=Ctenopharyngodon idella TaxID=7959 RepID=UPI002230121E|nr:axin-1-like isoform X2 [Ctenopharyngodon idella]
MSYHSDAPRPPVPGEEGCEGGRFSSKTPSDWSESPAVTPRRSDLDLGFEPEGSASRDGPYEPWAETLLTLLDDRDGTALFLHFLRTLGCSAVLEFWFACCGFQKVPEGATGRRLKLAKAMYRCYLSERSGCVVSRKITAETRSAVRDAIQRLQLDSGLFAQAHAQVQAVLQDSLFPLFLRSDVYLKHTQTVQSPRNHKTTLQGCQATPSEGVEPEKETLPPHSAANQKRPDDRQCRQHTCHRHLRARDERHTHLPHTPMTPHTFAAELTRRLQELQGHAEEDTDSSATSLMADSDCDIISTCDVKCVTVVYYYSGDVIPYRTCVRSDPAVTLGRFKSLLTRRGPFRFYFKRASAEFDCGAVYEEIRRDEAVLPTFEQKIIARVERMTDEMS